MNQIRIQVLFTIDNYSDALYYSLAEWQSVTEQKLEQDKQDRYNAWKALVEQMSVQVTEETEQVV